MEGIKNTFIYHCIYLFIQCKLLICEARCSGDLASMLCGFNSFVSSVLRQALRPSGSQVDWQLNITQFRSLMPLIILAWPSSATEQFYVFFPMRYLAFCLSARLCLSCSDYHEISIHLSICSAGTVVWVRIQCRLLHISRKVPMIVILLLLFVIKLCIWDFAIVCILQSVAYVQLCIQYICNI